MKGADTVVGATEPRRLRNPGAKQSICFSGVHFRELGNVFVDSHRCVFCAEAKHPCCIEAEMDIKMKQIRL